METGIYKLADRRVEICSLHSAVHRLCRDYAAEGEPDFTVRISQADIDLEREKNARQNASGGQPSDDYLETLAVYRKIAETMLCYDTLLIHGSAIALDGAGFLFTAKSGTGKSTHTRLWRERFGSRAVMVNDDKPLVRLTQDGAWVCGTPWDGKHRLSSNISVPLRAICLLERGTENEITPISAQEALPMLLQQCYRPRESRKLMKLLALMDDLAQRTAFFRLHCNMDPEAAQTAWEGLQNSL